MKRFLLCTATVTIMALFSGSVMGQRLGYTKGTIVAVAGDRIQVTVSDDHFWTLDLIQPCSWCEEGVSVLMWPDGPVRVTVERDLPAEVRRSERVKAFVIHKSQ
jgi:hypothetical protein